MDEYYESKLNKILSLVEEKSYVPMTREDMAFLMTVPAEERQLFYSLIEALISDGRLMFTKKKKLVPPSAFNMQSGEYRAHMRGFGFVISDKRDEEDIFIPPGNAGSAMHKDRVLCQLLPSSASGRRREGKIVKVLSRGSSLVVGLVSMSKNSCFVLPDDKKITWDIFIAKDKRRGAVEGHKVLVKIIKPPSEDRNPEGEVLEILGHANDPGVDILSIVVQHQLSTEFGGNVYKELEAVPDSVTENDIDSSRRDLRALTMVTIDGEDAKDLDDAVSLEVLPSGSYKLGVHIADVTHYVSQGSTLDKEAFSRGTSVYLVDRVIPMLPHKLSNGICSLNANTNRLALSCLMFIDKSGHVRSHEIVKSLINVDKRASYNDVHALLSEAESPLRTEYSDFIPMFEEMKRLSDILRQNRLKRGAIEFDFDECTILVDESGKPTDIAARPRNFATNIIEEFMLLCNETVAEEYHWLELPFVYRNHEEPDAEKMEKLSKFIRSFGYNLKGNMTHPKSIQSLLGKIESTPEETIISRVILRSFKQARYAAENSGHFGLAAKYYCHFTSPIRRYPDLQIHRIIKENIDGRLNKSKLDYYEKNLPEIARHCSETERNAEETEREVDMLKKVEYMSDKIGQSFFGVISSVTAWGLFVELPNTVEGLIQTSSLPYDDYEFHEEQLMLVGKHKKTVYKLGDSVQVMVLRASMKERRLYFSLAT